MNPQELHDFAVEVALELPHSRLTFPFGEEWEVFKVGERMFLLLTDTNGPQMVTMKVDPQEGRALVEAYDDVIPGYHLNKRHWLTVLSPVGEPEAMSVPETSSAPEALSVPEDSNPPESPKALEASSLPETSGAPDAPHSPARSSRRISAEELRELIISSYLLVIAKMPKKDRPIDPYAYGEIHDQKRDQHQKRAQRQKRDQRLT